MASSIFVALIALIAFTAASTTQRGAPVPTPQFEQESDRICPLPKCADCPSIEELRAPGVGFALETGHGTAAVRLHDGTVHDVALIEGGDHYIALMRRLATGPINREPDHFDSNWEKLRYLRKRAARLANKLAGRPATPETAILASMVSKLLQATHAWLGGSSEVAAAMISSPDRIRLTHEELGDVFDYLKLENLSNRLIVPTQLYATSASQAGYGQGLCKNYIDEYACESEKARLPTQRALHLDLSYTSLSGSIRLISSAQEGYADTTFIDPSLGTSRRRGREGLVSEKIGDDPEYWLAVSQRIRDLVDSCNRVYLPHVTELILTGPSATELRFHDAIKEALQDKVADDAVGTVLNPCSRSADSPAEWESLFSFATARGAAEIAKRRQEGPVECAQTDVCRRRRKIVHDGGEARLVFQGAKEAV